MTFNTNSKYPTRRAYVLKVRGDAKPDALAGRLENLVTGQQCEFASGRELLESIAGDLEATLHGGCPVRNASDPCHSAGGTHDDSGDGVNP